MSNEHAKDAKSQTHRDSEVPEGEGGDPEAGEAMLLLLADSYSRALVSQWRWLLIIGPSLLVVVAWLLGMTWAPNTARAAYFEASAQIVPVLLLALAVESRLLRLVSPKALAAAMRSVDPMKLLDSIVSQLPATRNRPLDRFLKAMLNNKLVARVVKALAILSLAQRTVSASLMTTGVLAVLILAEWESLRAVATMHGEQTRDPSLVSGGILAGLIGIGLIALLGSRIGPGTVEGVDS